MRLLLDQGLPRSTVLYLQNYGIEAVHVGDRGLATASDSKILNFGHQERMVAVTLDADFHTLLALPSGGSLFRSFKSSRSVSASRSR
jgi:predicted nuclease of predicted toxin-antitoxin system